MLVVITIATVAIMVTIVVLAAVVIVIAIMIAIMVAIVAVLGRRSIVTMIGFVDTGRK